MSKPIRSASRMICSGGSSRVTYSACSPCSMPSIRNWIANVDLPVPLEPRMTTVDFGQNPPSMRSSSPGIPLATFVLRPIEAGGTAQADDVLGSDLFDLLLPNIRPDPFEPCFRSALSACAHGSPSRYDSTGLLEELRAVP